MSYVAYCGRGIHCHCNKHTNKNNKYNNDDYDDDKNTNSVPPMSQYIDFTAGGGGVISKYGIIFRYRFVITFTPIIKPKLHPH